METETKESKSIPLQPQPPAEERTVYQVAFTNIEPQDISSENYFKSKIQFSASMANKVAQMEEGGILKKGMIDTLKSSIGQADYLILGNAIHEVLEFHGDLDATSIVKIESMPSKSEMTVLTCSENYENLREYVEAYIEQYNNVNTRTAYDNEKAYKKCEEVVIKMRDTYSDFLSALVDNKIPCTQWMIDVAMKAWDNVSKDKEIYNWYFPNEGRTDTIPTWMKFDDEGKVEVPQEGRTDWMEFPEMKFKYTVELRKTSYSTDTNLEDIQVRQAIEKSFATFAKFDGKGMMDKVALLFDYSNKTVYYRLGDYKSSGTGLNDFVQNKYKDQRDYWRQIGLYNRLICDWLWNFLKHDIDESESDHVSTWDIEQDVRILAIQTNEWANIKDIKIGVGDLIHANRGGFINPISSYDKSGVYTDIFMQQNNPYFGYKEFFKKGIESTVMTYWEHMSDEMQDSLRVDKDGNYIEPRENSNEELVDEEKELNADDYGL